MQQNIFVVNIMKKNVGDVIEKLKGIDCNGKGTSCPDQLSYAIEEAMKQNA